ncbi:MAG TPA: hypothetical protein VIZ66_08360 [Sphingomicrobium sp.]
MVKVDMRRPLAVWKCRSQSCGNHRPPTTAGINRADRPPGRFIDIPKAEEKIDMRVAHLMLACATLAIGGGALAAQQAATPAAPATPATPATPADPSTGTAAAPATPAEPATPASKSADAADQATPTEPAKKAKKSKPAQVPESAPGATEATPGAHPKPKDKPKS